MLFNLSQEKVFKNTGTGKEIFCWNCYGPCFGDSELKVCMGKFNEDENCVSYAYHEAYKIPLGDGRKNMLTNKENGLFTITELEVWEVKYLE
jgi:hypothetical protein